MSILNMLAQGPQYQQIEPRVNALMRAQEARGMQQKNALMQIQMQQAQAEQESAQRNALMQQQFRESIPSPQMQASQQALSGGGGPTQANAATMQPVDPRLQMLHGGMRAGMVSPMDYMKEANPKPEYVTMKPGDSRVDARTNKVAFTTPFKPEDKRTADQKNYEAAKAEGFSGNLQDFMLSQRKAGATNVSLNTSKPLMNEIAGGLGKQIDASLSAAKAAQGAITTSHALIGAIDSGKIVAGPGASFRVLGLQIGQSLGIGGKDGAEVLSNTRTAIQSMAQSELDAAQQMKGQGQITEAERDIIRRAASGNIDGMTAPEIRLLATTMDKMARSKIKAHQSNFEALKKMPEAAPLLPFYSVDQPPAYSGGQAVRKYNPATGKIE